MQTPGHKPTPPRTSEYLHSPKHALSTKFHRYWWELARSFATITSVRWIIFGVGMGVASGLAAIAFFYGIELLKHLWLGKLAGLLLPEPAGESMFEHVIHGDPRPWVVPLLTTSVGLLTGYLVSRFIPETVHSGTDGTDAMIKAFHQQGGVIRPVVPIIKGLTSILTIASGGSAGREGPITQIGAGLGSFFALKLKLSARERRILLLAGAAGGLGAIFRAPMGAALTAIEVIYLEDFETEAVLPAVLSSVVAYTLFTLVFGHEPIFGIPAFHFHNPLELPFYVILAVFCSLMGWIYVKTFRTIKYSIFQRMQQRIGLTLATGIGGLGMGIMGMFYPHLLTGGYGWLELAILGNLGAGVMLLIALGKTVATSLTIGSGMSGGMFAPALFVGGMSGGVVGKLANEWFPDIVTQPGAYVLVGMAAFFAGVANAPIGPLFMVCELTKGYGLLAPLMLASALCLVLSRKVSLYENQRDNKFDSPAHVGDATINVLERLQVVDVYKPGRGVVLEESVSLKALVDIITGSNEFSFPVVNHGGEFTGILALQDVRKVLFEDTLYDVVLVKDLARKPVYVRLDYDLYAALVRFVGTDLSQLPVLNEKNEIVGSLGREAVFKAYSETIKTLQDEDALGHHE